MTSSLNKANLALLSAVIIWSFSFVAIRIALEGYSPGTLAFFRFSTASIFMIIPFFYPQIRKSCKPKVLLFALLIGVTGLAGYSICLNTGEKTVNPGLASFVVGQTPVITAIFAIIFLKERPQLLTISGIFISCLGMTVILFSEPFSLDFQTGLIFIMAATVCGSIHSILQKRLLNLLSPFLVTAYSTFMAAICLSVFIKPFFKELYLASWQSTAAVLFLGILPSGIGQCLWAYGLSKSTVIHASSYLYAMPLFTTFFGFLILGEFPTPWSVVGGVTVIFGAMIVNKDGTKKTVVMNSSLEKRPS